MLSLGFVSAILPTATLSEVLQTASKLHYDCVEVMCWPLGKAERRYAGVTHVDASEVTETSLAEVKRLQDETGVTISSLGYYPNLLSIDDASNSVATRHLRRVIEMSAALSIDRVTTFIGRHPGKSVDENWQPMLDRWGPLVECAEQNGVKIGIENCPMLFTRDEWPGGHNLAISPSIWRRLFRDLPSPSLGLNYDPSHFVWMQMEPIGPLIEFADRVFHVHAKDVRVDQSKLNDVGILAHPNEYHSPKLPGLGQVDWSRFFATLTDVGYTGPVCVEVEDRAYEASDADRMTALRQCESFLRQFIPRSPNP